jgi:hypothetical protein
MLSFYPFLSILSLLSVIPSFQSCYLCTGADDASPQPLLILFLFCSPDIDTLFGLAAPQPFVIIYQLALGQAGQVVMTFVAIVGLFIVRTATLSRD